MKKPRRLALLLVVPALALGACGGGNDEDDIKDIVKDISDDPAALCEHATKDVLKQVGGSEATCKKAASGERKDRDVEVKSVDVDGDKAAAKIEGEDTDGEQTIRFEKEDGDWKIANVD